MEGRGEEVEVEVEVDCVVHPQSFQYARVKRELKIGTITI